MLAVRCQRLTDALASRADARDVRRGALSGFLDLEHGRKRTVASRSARPVRHGKELGPELRQLRARRDELFRALRRGRRKELEAEETISVDCHSCLAYMPRSFLAGK